MFYNINYIKNNIILHKIIGVRVMEWIFVAILTVSIIHVIEEYNGGFVDQIKQFVPGTDLSQFVSTNVIFLSLTACKMAYYYID